MAAQNYRVEIHQFGEWTRGTVLPEFVCLWAFGEQDADPKEQIGELVGRNIVAPTRDEPTKATLDRVREITGARQKARARAEASAVPESAQVEIETLRSKVREHADAADALTLRAEAAEKRAKSLADELTDYVERNAHLSKVCDEHQEARDHLEKQLAALKAEHEKVLEAVTAPAAK